MEQSLILHYIICSQLYVLLFTNLFYIIILLQTQEFCALCSSRIFLSCRINVNKANERVKKSSEIRS